VHRAKGTVEYIPPPVCCLGRKGMHPGHPHCTEHRSVLSCEAPGRGRLPIQVSNTEANLAAPHPSREAGQGLAQGERRIPFSTRVPSVRNHVATAETLGMVAGPRTCCQIPESPRRKISTFSPQNWAKLCFLLVRRNCSQAQFQYSRKSCPVTSRSSLHSW
jgi:hypothetical protein